MLTRNQEEITRRAGRPINIVKVADRNLELARQVTGNAVAVTDDAFAVVDDPNIDDLTEAIGRIAQFLERYRKRHSGKNRMKVVNA